jgi:hypothetical protein
MVFAKELSDSFLPQGSFTLKAFMSERAKYTITIILEALLILYILLLAGETILLYLVPQGIPLALIIASGTIGLFSLGFSFNVIRESQFRNERLTGIILILDTLAASILLYTCSGSGLPGLLYASTYVSVSIGLIVYAVRISDDWSMATHYSSLAVTLTSTLALIYQPVILGVSSTHILAIGLITSVAALVLLTASIHGFDIGMPKIHGLDSTRIIFMVYRDVNEFVRFDKRRHLSEILDRLVNEKTDSIILIRKPFGLLSRLILFNLSIIISSLPSNSKLREIHELIVVPSQAFTGENSVRRSEDRIAYVSKIVPGEAFIILSLVKNALQGKENAIILVDDIIDLALNMGVKNTYTLIRSLAVLPRGAKTMVFFLPLGIMDPKDEKTFLNIADETIII